MGQHDLNSEEFTDQQLEITHNNSDGGERERLKEKGVVRAEPFVEVRKEQQIATGLGGLCAGKYE